MAPGWMTADKQPMPGMKDNALDAPHPMGATNTHHAGGRARRFGMRGRLLGVFGARVTAKCGRIVSVYTHTSGVCGTSSGRHGLRGAEHVPSCPLPPNMQGNSR